MTEIDPEHADPPPPLRPPPPKGRATGLNTPNRFEPLHIEPDPLEPDDEDFRDREPTQYFHDTTKSLLTRNDSPDVGFAYSINPYRGCEHGCIYCVSGETPILMGDGACRPLAELGEGDEIYGTQRRGHYRRYVRTRVLAHWEVRKPAFRITLHDGTELVAAGDHRFLTLRGWKFVTGTEQGRSRRPHLTANDELLGTGTFSSRTSTNDPDYRRGYLCGLIRGDGHLASYSYTGRQRGKDEQHQFRLALADFEALQRASGYLETFRIETKPFVFQRATANRRVMRGIRSSARRHVERIRDLIDWPSSPSLSWSRGFLAGIFDAEGHYGQGSLRIANTAAPIIEQTTQALHRLGHSSVVEKMERGKGRLIGVRILGGLRRHLRFIHEVEPAIRRKCSIEGRALKSSVPSLGVVSIEPLGSMTLFDITTGTGDFIADGAVSHNCYARPSHEYLGFSAGIDFETRILVKHDAPERLEEGFRKKSWVPQVVALSGNTDCYQPVEKKLEITRRCLEVFLEFRNPVTIITKNHLVTRDVDILRELAALDLVHVTLSITSLRPKLTNAMEPRTSRPELRLKALQTLARNQIPCGVNVAPLIPGLNDEEVPAILKASADHGAQWGNYIMLRLPGAVKPLFIDWLQRQFPDRAGKIISRLKSVRSGQLSDPRFGSRMRGEGELADFVANLFELSRRRYGLHGSDRELTTEHFRRGGGGQLELF